MSLTGKQKSFVSLYLGEANFNATLAARLAGYRATTKHSFESIGSENLQRPAIAEKIDEHFKLAHVSAEEVLIELGKLARGSSKDKIKALALLSQHHGLLDPSKWQAKQDVQITVRYADVDRQIEDELIKYRTQVEKDVNELNRKGLATYQEVKKKFADKPDVQAFCSYYEAMLAGKQPPEPGKPATEVEIIPPSRRLQSAPVERMMAEVIDVEEQQPEPQPARCRHGNLEGECHVIDVGKDQCPHWYRSSGGAKLHYA